MVSSGKGVRSGRIHPSRNTSVVLGLLRVGSLITGGRKVGVPADDPWGAESAERPER